MNSESRIGEMNVSERTFQSTVIYVIKMWNKCFKLLYRKFNYNLIDKPASASFFY